MPHIPVIVIAVVVIVAMILLIAAIFVRNYVKVPPNQVAVFTGRGKQKIVRGGARFRVPGIEQVNFMSLEPFAIDISVENVFSNNGVPVNVSATSLVRFGSSDEMIATAVERWLTTPRDTLQKQVTEMVAGNMRSIVAQMTVEELNGNRDQLTQRVIAEATAAFAPIGMELDVLTIRTISDNNGYLDAMGRTRIAEVKRDAAIGEATANQQTRVQAAAADQTAAEAEAIAATAVAEANQKRDVRVAQLSAETDAETAKASQAGPLAEAQASAAVGVAEAQAAQQKEQANIAVEEQRALRAEKAQRADVIVPAEAKKQATVLEAEGKRQAAILEAEATSQQTKLNAEATAEQTKLKGESESDARKLQAEATQVEMEAQARGEQAKLEAQAEGTTKLAEAQNMFNDSALRLQVLPKVIEALPGIAQAIADGVKIDHMVVMDGGHGDGKDGAFQRAASTVPTTLFQLNKSLEAMGIDLSSFLGGLLSTQTDKSDKDESTPAAVGASAKTSSDASADGTQPVS